MDRISELPPGIIETVLCRLPIQEAARTSILSKGWRYRWIKIPKLAFNERNFEVAANAAELSDSEETSDDPSTTKEMPKRCKLFYAIYQVLLMHQGPIHEFTLCMEADNSCVEIDHIILRLSKMNTLKKLSLDLEGRFMLPLSLFSLRQLTDLYLSGCALDHRLSFSGFGSLTTLSLHAISTSTKALLRLLSGCPSLKTLTLHSTGTGIGVSEDLTIADFFKCLPVIEHLSIWFPIVLGFHPNTSPMKLPTTLVHLKSVILFGLCFSHKYGLPFLVTLIRSSPNLENLTLPLFDRSYLGQHEMGSFTLKDYSDITLEHLLEFVVVPFSNEANELDFVKLVLAKSPVLKKVVVRLSNQFTNDEELQISRILLSSPCASPEPSQQEYLKMDRISQFPPSIIETILCLLPIQEAARTSILSREWRYHWTTIPKLVFNEDAFQVSDELSVLEQTFDEPSHRKIMTSRCKLFYAIYQVMLMHHGAIHEFTLSMHVDGSCVEIDHILRYLSKKNTVKILKLDLIGSPYKLPLSLFSQHQLTNLYLSHCALDHPPSSYVFGSLTTLNLQDIQTCKKELLLLLSSCPLLKRLTIMSDCGTIDESGDSTIADLVEGLPVIEYLCVLFFIFACFLPLPKELPTTMVHLKYLCMEYVVFSHKNAVPFLSLLIRSSPNLEKLKLEIYVEVLDESVTGAFKLEDDTDIMLEHLSELEILHYSNEENELTFVKFILAKSPVLKKVRILLWDELNEDEKLHISKILLTLPCASPVVEVIVS